MYHYSEERATHGAHLCAYMHTPDSVHPKYTLGSVRVNFTLEAVGPLRAFHRAHTRAYMHTHITNNQYSQKDTTLQVLVRNN